MNRYNGAGIGFVKVGSDALRMHWPLALVLAALTVLLPHPSQASSARSSRHVLVLVVDRTTLANLDRPHLEPLASLLHRASVGLMNSNTAAAPGLDAAAMTIASSEHLRGLTAAQMFDASTRLGGVSAGEIYRRNTGVAPPPGSVVALNLAGIVRENLGLEYVIHIGYLGQVLQDHGLKTAALGNSDIVDATQRPPAITVDRGAAAMVMNSQGIVPMGDVSSKLLRRAPLEPYGVELRNHLLARKTLDYLQRAAVVEVDYGDTDRADAYQYYGTPAAIAHGYMTHAVDRFNTYLRLILPHIDLASTEIILVSPTPSRQSQHNGATLTPLVIAGGPFHHGLLTSGTTHRRGIVSDVDIAPTILRFLLGMRTPPLDMFGQYCRTLTFAHPLQYLGIIGPRIAATSIERVPILRPTVYYIALLFVLAVLYLGLRRRRLGLARALSALVATVLYLPVTLLLLSGIHSLSLGESFLFLIVSTLALTALTLWVSSHPLDPIWIPSLLIIALLMGDVLTGAHLIKGSPLGYDPQIGARYYGIGNEYMGVLVGAGAIGLPAFMDRFKLRSFLPAAAAVYAFVVLVLVLPGLGTKAGGAITATAAYGVTLLLLSGRKVRGREVLGIAGVIVLMLLMLVGYDLLVHAPGHRTDIGRAGALVAAGGPYQALLIIVRKLQTNLILTQASYWTLLLVASIIAAVLALTRSTGITREIARRYPMLSMGLVGAGVGVVVGYFFNDTGVVAASTAVIYPISALLHLSLTAPEVPEIVPAAAETSTT